MTEARTDQPTIRFTRDGRTIRARPGQSIAGALYAHGDRALSRSLKFHRPRGWACGTGDCNNCMMRVDGIPTVKTCQEPAREGAVVKGQNAWPSVRHDIFRGSDIVFRHELDHHRSFVRPKILYGLFGKVIRAFAGWGTLPTVSPEPPAQDVLRPDVAVIGAGPAGLAAAEAASSAGASVLLLERSDALGGHPARMQRPLPDPQGEPGDVVPAADLVRRWRETIDSRANIDVRTQTALAAAYRNGLCIAESADRTILFRPRSLIATTGGYASQAVFDNNDLPGIMDAAGCQALLHREGVVPGRRALVIGAGAHGLHVARDLLAAGLDVVGVAEPGGAVLGAEGDEATLRSANVPIWTDTHIEKASGWGRVRRVELRHDHGKRRRVAADIVVIALGQKPAADMFQGLGAKLAYRPERGGAIPLLDPDMQTTMPGLFAAGDCAGIGTVATACTSGRLAGFAAARHAGHDVDEALLVPLRDHLEGLRATDGGPPSPHRVTMDPRAAPEVTA